MRFHTFNIGKPHIDSWWERNRKLGVITAGFSGESGDRGDVVLHQMDEGDWVLAYSNGHGFVGAGQVGSASTYRLLPPDGIPPGWEATHRHLRQVDWVHAVASLAEAVPADEVGRQAPRQTRELLPDEVGYRLIQLLASRSNVTVPKETLAQFSAAFAAEIEHSSRNTSDARRERLKNARKLPERIPVLSYEFARNPDVVAEVLYGASGSCNRCGSAAPFKRRTDGSPYLEVHHRIPLAAGGEDTVENATALCPNCHRECHYGASAA